MQLDLKTVLDIADISFSYNPAASPCTWTVSNLSLSVRQGEIVCILGASGCGKSTLLNLIAGLLSPQSGRLNLSSSSAAGNHIGYIFQQDALLPWRTVSANLALVADLQGQQVRSKTKELLPRYMRIFNLNDEILGKFPSQLSGGMRQRVSIIQALLFDPLLLLLDEPFSALDFYTKLKLESEFCRLVSEQKKSAILVTHDIDEAIAMADRVFIMNSQGQLGHEFIIDLAQSERSPETARGTPKFAEYYGNIWSELKSVIAN
jgi:NitT/TauT family transport system ATP-binding protein